MLIEIIDKHKVRRNYRTVGDPVEFFEGIKQYIAIDDDNENSKILYLIKKFDNSKACFTFLECKFNETIYSNDKYTYIIHAIGKKKTNRSEILPFSHENNKIEMTDIYEESSDKTRNLCDFETIIYNGGFNEIDTVSVAIDLLKSLINHYKEYRRGFGYLNPSQILIIQKLNKPIEGQPKYEAEFVSTPFKISRMALLEYSKKKDSAYAFFLDSEHLENENDPEISFHSDIHSIGKIMAYMLTSTNEHKPDNNKLKDLGINTNLIQAIHKCCSANTNFTVEEIESDLERCYELICKKWKRQVKYKRKLHGFTFIAVVIVALAFNLFFRKPLASTTKLTIAEEYAHTGRYSESQTLFKEYIAENENDDNGRLAYIRFELLYNNPQICLKQLNEIIPEQLNDNNRYFYYCLKGQVQESLKDNQNALDSYSKAVAIVNEKKGGADKGKSAYLYLLMLNIKTGSANTNRIHETEVCKRELKKLAAGDTFILRYIEAAEQYEKNDMQPELYKIFYDCLDSSDSFIVKDSFDYLIKIAGRESDFEKRKELFKEAIGKIIDMEYANNDLNILKTQVIISYAEKMFIYGINSNLNANAYQFYIDEAKYHYEKLIESSEMPVNIYVNLVQIMIWEKDFSGAEKILDSAIGGEHHILITLMEINLENAIQKNVSNPEYTKLEYLYKAAYDEIQKEYRAESLYKDAIEYVLSEIHELLESGLIDVPRIE